MSARLQRVGAASAALRELSIGSRVSRLVVIGDADLVVAAVHRARDLHRSGSGVGDERQREEQRGVINQSNQQAHRSNPLTIRSCNSS